MLPDLNRLKVFFHIYNEQSSTGAAKILHITQSGVSQHLKKLEQELRVQLFVRVNRKLIPTTAAHELHRVVGRFLNELENGVRHMDQKQEIPAGKLRIGAPSEFGRAYIPQIFGTFHRKYPRTSLHLELADPKALFNLIAEGRLDFAYVDILPFFMDTPGGPASYSITPVVNEEFVLACSRRYYESRVIGAGFDKLCECSFIGYKEDTSLFRSWFKLHFRREPHHLNQIFTADSSGAIVRAIEEGLGLGMVVSHMVNRHTAQGKIVTVQPTLEKLHNTIACVHLKNKNTTLTETEFQKHFRKELEQNYAKLDLC